ncbi:unnamed protein product, partial [Iphiclides podalirius]
MRKRQFLKRNHWCRKYNNSQETIDSDIFLKDIDRLAAKIISDGEKELNRDVIDLVSSDESSEEGYIVKPGIKFGGDYLLYREGPGINHADIIVLIRYHEEKHNWTSILGQVRVASSTVKDVLIAEVVKTSGKMYKLPHDLREYSVREILLSRTIPVSINNDDE